MKSLLFLQNLGAGEIIIIALVNDVEKEIGSVEDDVKKAGKDAGKDGDYQK